jgi:hypothetical protein
MAMRIAQGRKEREIDPAAAALKECVAKAETEAGIDPVVLKRLHDMQEFMDTTNRWYVQMLGVPKAQLNRLMKMGDKVLSVLKFTGKRTQ